MAKNYLTRNRDRKEELELIDHPSGLVPWEINFCMEYALCGHVLDAYKRICKTEELSDSDQSLRMKGLHLLRKPVVVRYLRSLNQRLEELGVASLLEIQTILTDAIRTPIGDIDEDHPLCQKKTVTERTDKDGNTTRRTTLESVSKMEATKALIQMKGWNSPIKVDHNHSGGVMLVPMTSDANEWAKLAADSQQALMEDAIDV